MYFHFDAASDVASSFNRYYCTGSRIYIYSGPNLLIAVKMSEFLQHKV